MTEQEIVDYLKENKRKGVAFAFMPEDVKEWCKQHSNESIFIIYYKDDWEIDSCIRCYYNGIYALPDAYEIKPEFKAHYEEFDIDKDGFFYVKKGSDLIYYHWYNWPKFLDENFDNYNNFGGWLYNDKLWSTNVLMSDINSDTSVYSGKDKTVVPVTPTKIKFWRYKH